MLSNFFDLIARFLDSWWYFHIFASAMLLVWILFGNGRFRSAAKFFLYASSFSILIVMVSTFFPFIGGKDYFFRASIEIALIFSIFWWAFEAKAGDAMNRLRAVSAKPIFIAVSAFVLVYFLSSLFAHDPNAAFWSNYERGEGAFQMLHYYAFFVLAVLFFDKKEDWLKFFRVSVYVALLMIAYGVAANLGWAPRFISTYAQGMPEGAWTRLTQGRFHGSLGNPVYVAPYLIFAFFYLFYLWGERAAKNIKKFLLYGLAAVVFMFFFLLSQARAGMVGLSVSVFVFLVYLIFSSRRWRKFLFVALVVLIFAGGTIVRYKDSGLVRSLPFWKIFNISFSTSELWTFNTRLWTWGSAWRGFLDRPILGWGPENFTAVFDKYFDPRHHVPGEQRETWFDRAHSIYFDYLTGTGIVGLAAYLSIFGVIFSRFIKKWTGYLRKNHQTLRGEESALAARDTQPAREIIKEALLFSLLVGYLVQGAAIFDVFPMYISLFAVFAFSHYYFSASEQHKENIKK